MESTLRQLEKAFNGFLTNAKKAESGNKAAGARARKASMQVRELSKKWKAESLHN